VLGTCLTQLEFARQGGSRRILERGSIRDYEVVEEAGFGAMGVVYKARQRSLDRLVALKVIGDDIAPTPRFRERFLREARAPRPPNTRTSSPYTKHGTRRRIV